MDQLVYFILARRVHKGYCRESFDLHLGPPSLLQQFDVRTEAGAITTTMRRSRTDRISVALFNGLPAQMQGRMVCCTRLPHWVGIAP
jgi:hypothetical protein